MADSIDSLPIDDLPPSHDEKEMIHWIYKVDPTTGQSISESKPNEVSSPSFRIEMRTLFFLFLITFLYGLPQFDSWMISLFPVFGSLSVVWYILKAFSMTVLLLLFINICYIKLNTP